MRAYNSCRSNSQTKTKHWRQWLSVICFVGLFCVILRPVMS